MGSFLWKNDIIYHITAFSSQMKTFEKDGKTPDERLETIKNTQAFIKMYESIAFQNTNKKGITRQN